jgi:hypothetical protein
MKDPRRESSPAFLRAILRSASGDRPPPGARARALARLEADDASLSLPRGFAGALLVGAVAVGLSWGPRIDAGGPSTRMYCRESIEAPRGPCNEGRSASGDDSPGAISWSAPAAGLSLGSSGR